MIKHAHECLGFKLKFIFCPPSCCFDWQNIQRGSCDKCRMWKTSTTNTDPRLEWTEIKEPDRLVERAAGLAANNQLRHCKFRWDNVLAGNFCSVLFFFDDIFNLVTPSHWANSLYWYNIMSLTSKADKIDIFSLFVHLVEWDSKSLKLPKLQKGHKNKTTKMIPSLIIRIKWLLITVMISHVKETATDIFVGFRVNNGFLGSNGT